MNPQLITEQALAAAALAAGSSWALIADGFAADLQQVIANATTIASEIKAGELSLEEAEDLVVSEGRQRFVLTEEAAEEKQIIAEAAVNAAIGVVWGAVKEAVAAV